MFNFKKVLSALLGFIIILTCFSGCGKNYDDAHIYFELLEVPKTLDPQTASTDSELLIVRNIYEGLLRKDENGEIVNGVIEGYTYNNLTYTFNLKKDAVWSDGTPLTAYDFEYALKRAVNPKINAPFANRLSAIENAALVIAGKLDASNLGVYASDDYTLVIKMQSEDENFKETLTTSVCMPCNEEFFNTTVGKYGLDSNCILSNGSYRISKWNKEEFGIRIYKNEKYNGTFKAKNGAVFIECVNDEDQVSRLTGGDSDMAFMLCSEFQNCEKADLETKQIQNICWFLTVGQNFNLQVRNAFASAFSNDVYKNSLLDGFTPALSIYPEILNINTDGIGITEYNLENAKSIMSEQIAGMENKKFPQTVMYYYNTDGARQLATAIVGHWQQNLGSYVNIESSNNLNALQKEINEQSLDFALFPITVKSDLFSEYASVFAVSKAANSPEALQKELLKNNTVIPVAFQSTNVAYVSNLENAFIDDANGYVDFSQIIKK